MSKGLLKALIIQCSVLSVLSFVGAIFSLSTGFDTAALVFGVCGAGGLFLSYVFHRARQRLIIEENKELAKELFSDFQSAWEKEQTQTKYKNVHPLFEE